MFSGKTRYVVGVLLVLAMLFSLTGVAMAETGASDYYDVNKELWTFSVTTESNWGRPGSESITFGQTKGKRKIPVWKGFPLPRLTYKYKTQ